MRLVRGFVERTIPTLYPDWTIEFDIQPLTIKSGWNNILHLSEGGPEDKYLEHPVTPAIWFSSGTSIVVYMTKGTSPSVHVVESSALALKQWTSVKISQTSNAAGNVEFVVKVQDKVIHSEVLSKPREFHDVNVFAGNPWYPAADAMIKNLYIETTEGENK